MSALSFYEKSAWGTLLVLAVLGGLYFERVIGLARADALSAETVVPMAIIFTIFLVAALVAFHAMIAVSGQPEAEDERDRQIGRRAAYWSGHAMGVGVFSVIFSILAASGLGRPALMSPLVIVHALIAVVLISELIDLALRILFYRRGV
jgi:hypothetical protein